MELLHPRTARPPSQVRFGFQLDFQRPDGAGLDVQAHVLDPGLDQFLTQPGRGGSCQPLPASLEKRETRVLAGAGSRNSTAWRWSSGSRRSARANRESCSLSTASRPGVDSSRASQASSRTEERRGEVGCPTTVPSRVASPCRRLRAVCRCPAAHEAQPGRFHAEAGANPRTRPRRC